MLSEKKTRQVYQVCEVAAILGFSTGRVYDLIRRGIIPSIRFGRQVRVPVESLRGVLQVADQTHSSGYRITKDGS
jgi:excisionase family DNA binding protein